MLYFSYFLINIYLYGVVAINLRMYHQEFLGSVPSHGESKKSANIKENTLQTFANDVIQKFIASDKSHELFLQNSGRRRIPAWLGQDDSGYNRRSLDLKKWMTPTSEPSIMVKKEPECEKELVLLAISLTCANAIYLGKVTTSVIDCLAVAQIDPYQRCGNQIIWNGDNCFCQRRNTPCNRIEGSNKNRIYEYRCASSHGCPSTMTMDAFDDTFVGMFTEMQLDNWYDNGADCKDSRAVNCIKDNTCSACLTIFKPKWKRAFDICTSSGFQTYTPSLPPTITPTHPPKIDLTKIVPTCIDDVHHILANDDLECSSLLRYMQCNQMFGEYNMSSLCMLSCDSCPKPTEEPLEKPIKKRNIIFDWFIQVTMGIVFESKLNRGQIATVKFAYKMIFWNNLENAFPGNFSPLHDIIKIIMIPTTSCEYHIETNIYLQHGQNVSEIHNFVSDMVDSDGSLKTEFFVELKSIIASVDPTLSIGAPFLKGAPGFYHTCPHQMTWDEYQGNFTEVFTTTQLDNWYENGAHCVDNRALICLENPTCYICLERWKPEWKLILDKCKATRKSLDTKILTSIAEPQALHDPLTKVLSETKLPAATQAPKTLFTELLPNKQIS